MLSDKKIDDGIKRLIPSHVYELPANLQPSLSSSVKRLETFKMAFKVRL